jgi:hypothetical protein
MKGEETTNESRGLVGGGGGRVKAEETTNESRGLVGDGRGHRGHIEAEETTNESSRLVGGPVFLVVAAVVGGRPTEIIS